GGDRMTHSPETCWQFTDARDALFWSADVLRQRRLPRLTSLWREVVEAAPVSPAICHLEKEAVPSLRASHLPDEPEDRYALALAVEKLIGGLSEEDRQLLRLH